MSTKTCGELYLEGLKTLKTEQERRAFAKGFVSGQAEKVHLGACQAAMFRPSDETYEWLLEVVHEVCARYCLGWQVIGGENGIAREIWICRHTYKLGLWLRYPKDSPEWHLFRGQACGVPAHEMDLKFHERPEYEKPCDGKAAVVSPGYAEV